MAVTAVADDISDIADAFTVGAAILTVFRCGAGTGGVGAFLESFHTGIPCRFRAATGSVHLLEFGVGRVLVFRQVTTR